MEFVKEHDVDIKKDNRGILLVKNADVMRNTKEEVLQVFAPGTARRAVFDAVELANKAYLAGFNKGTKTTRDRIKEALGIGDNERAG